MNISKNCNPNIKILITFSLNRYTHQQKSVRKLIVCNFEVYKFSTDMDGCYRCYPIIAVIALSILSVR